MSRRVDVAVVGLGAMGAAVLYHLARRGIAAEGFDRFVPPHAGGSSHGDSRITRCAIGEGPAYTPLAQRSGDLWRLLEQATGTRLMEVRGCLVMAPARPGSRGGEFLATTLATAEAHGIEHERLDSASLARRFPQFDGIEGLAACFEPGAGALRPEACIAAQLAEASRLGAVSHTGTAVEALSAQPGGVRLETPAGPVLADRVVVAAGAWAGRLLGAPFSRVLTPQRQVQHWFAVDEGAASLWRDGPAFIRAHGDGAHFSYGIPDLDGAAIVKIGSHDNTPAADPEAGLAPPVEGEAEALHAAMIAGQARGVRAEALRSAACFYTMTPDGHFLIDEHPEMPGVTVLAACSGHGFKHSAALGEAVAARVMGDMPAHADLKPFALSRFG